jgi:hypothetical protein
MEETRTVRCRTLIATLALAVCSTPAVGAQTIEISPFVGVRGGGSVTDVTAISYELDATASYGLGVEVALKPEAHIQLLWSHQPTGVDRFSFDDDGRVDLDVDYFHIGTTYIWDPLGSTRPFLGMTVGATRVASPDEGSSSTHFSFSIGGGVKLMLNNTVGFRLDGRLYGTWGGSGSFAVGCSGGCIVGFSGDFLWQAEATAGLVIGF